MKWFYSAVLVILFWQNANGYQSYGINDFESTSLLLLNRDGPHIAFHIKNLYKSSDPEINQKARPFIDSAVYQLTALGVLPESLLLFLFQPSFSPEKDGRHKLAFCIIPTPASKGSLWAVSEGQTRSLSCKPLSASSNQQLCQVVLDLSREHQVVALSGVQFDPGCTRKMLENESRESFFPIKKMAVINYSRHPEPEVPDQTGPLIPVGNGQQKLLLSGGGGGGWDDFFDQDKKRPPWLLTLFQKSQVTISVMPPGSLFGDDGQTDSPGRSVGSHQNSVLIYLEVDGAERRLALSLDEWALLVEQGVARLPEVLHQVIARMLRYKDQRKQLLAELNWFMDKETGQPPSLVASILNELEELPPNELLLKSSLAEQLVPVYEAYLRQEAGWIAEREQPGNFGWTYFSVLQQLADLLSQRNAGEKVLNTLWGSEGRRLTLLPVGAMSTVRTAALLSAQIREIGQRIMAYLAPEPVGDGADTNESLIAHETLVRQAAGGGEEGQPTASGGGQITSVSLSSASASGSSAAERRGSGGQGGRGEDRGDGDRDNQASGSNRDSVISGLTCDECQHELTEADFQNLAGKGQSGPAICLRCENARELSTSPAQDSVYLDLDGTAKDECSSGNLKVDSPTPRCSLIRSFFRRSNCVDRREIIRAIKSTLLDNNTSPCRYRCSSLLDRAMKGNIRINLPLLKKIPVQIPTQSGVVTDEDIVKWFISGFDGKWLMAKAAADDVYKVLTQRLIGHGVKVNFKYKRLSPLHIALKNLPKAKESALLLLDSGADVNTKIKESINVERWYHFDSDPLIVLSKYFGEERRLYPVVRDEDDYSYYLLTHSLALVTEKSDYQILKKMLESNLNLDVNLSRPFYNTCLKGDYQSFLLLAGVAGKKALARIKKSGKKCSLFFILCSKVIESRKDSPDFIKAIADFLEFNLVESHSMSDLSRSAYSLYSNHYDQWELTHKACSFGALNILVFLLEHEYFRDNINRQLGGKTALDCAVARGNTACAEAIEKNCEVRSLERITSTASPHKKRSSSSSSSSNSVGFFGDRSGAVFW